MPTASQCMSYHMSETQASGQLLSQLRHAHSCTNAAAFIALHFVCDALRQAVLQVSDQVTYGCACWGFA